jgi:hypothetical protein
LSAQVAGRAEGERILADLRIWLADPATLRSFHGVMPTPMANLVSAGVEFIEGYLRDFDSLAEAGKDPLKWIRAHDARTREFILQGNDPNESQYR